MVPLATVRKPHMAGFPTPIRINYFGTSSELHGCIADVKRMRRPWDRGLVVIGCLSCISECLNITQLYFSSSWTFAKAIIGTTRFSLRRRAPDGSTGWSWYGFNAAAHTVQYAQGNPVAHQWCSDRTRRPWSFFLCVGKLDSHVYEWISMMILLIGSSSLTFQFHDHGRKVWK